MMASILLFTLATQDSAERAIQLLNEAAALLQKSRRIVIEAERRVFELGEEERAQVMARKFCIDPSGRFRCEARQGDSEWLVVDDGRNYWSLDIKKNEYTQYARQKRRFNDLLPGRLYAGEKPGEILGSDIKVVDHKDGGVTISWLIKGRGYRPTQHGLKLGKDRMPISYSEDSESPNGKTWERKEEYKIALDSRVEDDAFKFTPPAGSTFKPSEPLEVTPEPKNEIPKDAKALLSKTVAALRLGVSLAYEIEVTSTGPLDRTWKGKVVAKRPGRYRIEQLNSLIVGNVEACWYYDVSARKYDKYEPRQMPYSVAEFVAGLYLNPRAEEPLLNLADVDVTRDKDVEILTWSNVGSAETRYELRVDAKTSLPVSMTMETNKDGDVYRNVRKYGSFDLNRELAADNFKFIPPEGASERTAADSDWEGKLLPGGSVAPDLTGKDETGAATSLLKHKGKPILAVFDFPSSPEFRWVQDLDDTFAKRGLIVLSIQREGSMRWIQARKKVDKFTFPVLCLPDDYLPGPYGVRVIPTIYVIGSDGKIIDRMVKHESYGYAERKLRAALEKALTPR